MKKFAAILFLGVMLISLTACGDKDEQSSGTEKIGGLDIMEAPTDDGLDWGAFEIVE